MTVYAVAEYLRYLRRAKGRHGVHSPFVYRFVDECLRGEKCYTLRENIRRYFGPENVQEVSADDCKEWTGDIEKQQQATIFLVKDIHASRHHTACWNALCAESAFTLSIDLFGLGLLFRNNDFKGKQHFVLK